MAEQEVVGTYLAGKHLIELLSIASAEDRMELVSMAKGWADRQQRKETALLGVQMLIEAVNRVKDS